MSVTAFSTRDLPTPAAPSSSSTAPLRATKSSRWRSTTSRTASRPISGGVDSARTTKAVAGEATPGTQDVRRTALALTPWPPRMSAAARRANADRRSHPTQGAPHAHHHLPRRGDTRRCAGHRNSGARRQPSRPKRRPTHRSNGAGRVRRRWQPRPNTRRPDHQLGHRLPPRRGGWNRRRRLHHRQGHPGQRSPATGR